jgi:OOP family OmpA-OmpF porin
MNTRLALGIAALGIGACGGAFAQSLWDSTSPSNVHNYVGISGGQSKFRTDCASLFNCDQKDAGWKAYFGSTISDIFGYEIGYTNFGKIDASGGTTKAQAGNVSITAGVPIGDRFRLFAKGGGVYSRTQVSASTLALVPTGRKSGWGGTWGAGAALGVSPNVQVRLDWDRSNLDFVGGSRDVDMLSAGVQMRF